MSIKQKVCVELGKALNCNAKINQKFIVLFGAPGVGKGTYGKMLSKEFNIPIFSTGDELRRISSCNNDSFSIELKNSLNEGKLVK